MFHQQNVRRIFAGSYDDELKHKERLVLVNPNVCYIVCLAKGARYVLLLVSPKTQKRRAFFGGGLHSPIHIIRMLFNCMYASIVHIGSCHTYIP